jgi:hypothetical protein
MCLVERYFIYADISLLAITLAIYLRDSWSMFPSPIQDVYCLMEYLLRYVLNDRRAVVRFPTVARDLAFLQNIQTSSGFHPAFI